MTPADERRLLEQLLADVSALKRGEGYIDQDIKAVRAEAVAIEHRITARLNEVDEECREFRQAAAGQWKEFGGEIHSLRDDVLKLNALVTGSEKIKERKASTTVAWIGGAFLLLTGLVQTIGTLFGS